MPHTITLTDEQLSKIKTDMDHKTEMLTNAQVSALARKVNDEVNLPFVGEAKELIVFTKLVRWIDRTLYQHLPNEYYELVHDAHDGISREEAARIEERLTPLINKVIDIPIVPEVVESKIIGFVLGLIVNAMVKGLKLEEAPA
jgi:hypothetical protein